MERERGLRRLLGQLASTALPRGVWGCLPLQTPRRFQNGPATCLCSHGASKWQNIRNHVLTRRHKQRVPKSRCRTVAARAHNLCVLHREDVVAQPTREEDISGRRGRVPRAHCKVKRVAVTVLVLDGSPVPLAVGCGNNLHARVARPRRRGDAVARRNKRKLTCIYSDPVII